VEKPVKPTYDVVIIGGGLHCLATAYYLAKEAKELIPALNISDDITFPIHGVMFHLPEQAAPGQGGIPGHNLPFFVAKYKVESGKEIKPTNVRSPLVPPFLASFAGTNP